MRAGPAVNFGVGSWIERRARIAPTDVAFIDADRSFTYAEAAGRIRRLANGLRRLGVSRGDRVAWVGPNHVGVPGVALRLGTARRGAGSREPSVGARMRSARSSWMPSRRCVIQHATEDVPLPPSARHRIAVADPMDGAVDFEALVAESPDDPIETPVDLDDLCLLPHTSGTTGAPKGIMLTHANVTWNVVNFLSCAGFRGDDVTIAIAPFFRVGGTGVNVLPVLFVGGTVVVPRDTDADEILRLIERHRVSVGFGNPDLLEALARSELWPDVDLSSVRFVITGGAPVPERLIRAYLDRGVTLLQGYGLSEAAPLALLLDPESALGRIGSAGRPPLLVDVRIVDPDGAEVETGETGELEVRGPNVMAGYWNRPEATREVLSSDGWLRTGDAARSDDEGYVWIVDRVADRFLVDGRPVYPGDVERVLLRHPSVADVAVALAGSSGGEVVVALVVASDGSEATGEEILAFAARHLAPHQVPAAVRFVDRLPRNSVGKLIRSSLRALATEGAPE